MMERRRGDGRHYQRPNKAGMLCWYIWWWANGKDNYLSVAKELHKRPEDVTEKDAQALLRKRLRLKWTGAAPASPKRVTGRTVLAAYRVHLELKFKRKQQRWSHLPAHLLERKAKSYRGTLREVDAVERWLGDELVTPTMYPVLEAKAAQLLGPFKAGTIQSRFALFKAACKEAVRAGLLSAMPLFPTNEEGDSIREETIALEEHERIVAELKDPVDRDFVEFLRLSGWRPGEPLLLTWPMLRREPVPHVWLPLTKTDLGKVFVFDDPQAIALLARLRARARLDVPFLFHRAGRPIAYDTLWVHWRDAATAAGLPEKHMQDYRRSAYERLLGAGVDEETAMMWVGHESRRMMSRYNRRSVRRLLAASKQVATFENPRNTRASEVSGEAGLPS